MSKVSVGSKSSKQSTAHMAMPVRRARAQSKVEFNLGLDQLPNHPVVMKALPSEQKEKLLSRAPTPYSTGDQDEELDHQHHQRNKQKRSHRHDVSYKTDGSEQRSMSNSVVVLPDIKVAGGSNQSTSSGSDNGQHFAQQQDKRRNSLNGLPPPTTKANGRNGDKISVTKTKQSSLKKQGNSLKKIPTLPEISRNGTVPIGHHEHGIKSDGDTIMKLPSY